MSVAPRPAGMLSIDLDDYWSYLRSFGRDDWRQRPSFLTTALPRVHDCMASCGVDITVFVVGVDAQRDANTSALRALAEAGHEFGNHSWEHDPGVFAGTQSEIEQDVARADSAIEAITGSRPKGFRGPSYAQSQSLLDVLCARGYAYDASNFPMSLGALVALYQRVRRHDATRKERPPQSVAPGSFETSVETSRETTQRASLIGAIRQTWGTLRPHRIHDGQLAEFPVTTLPLLRFPIHFTYLHALGDWSPRLAREYLRMALALCALRRVPPSLLLHAADFMGADDPFDMHFLPGMRRRWADKQQLLKTLLKDYLERFEVAGIGRYLEQHPLP